MLLFVFSLNSKSPEAKIQNVGSGRKEPKKPSPQKSPDNSRTTPPPPPPPPPPLSPPGQAPPPVPSPTPTRSPPGYAVEEGVEQDEEEDADVLDIRQDEGYVTVWECWLWTACRQKLTCALALLK